MRMNTRFPLLLAIGLTLSACSQEPEPPTPQPASAPPPVVKQEPQMRPVQAAASSLPSQPAHLRTLLPEASIGYLRIPTPWGLLGSPKGAIFDQAVGSAPYVEAVKQIREGFGATVLPELPEETRILWSFALLHARSPIEALVMPSSMPGVPIPDLLISFASDFADAVALNDFLAAAERDYPVLQVISPINQSGDGLLSAGGMPVQIYFSVSDSRIYLLGSQAPGSERLSHRISALQPVSGHPMHTLEKRMDTSGQGLFVWLDTPRLLKTLESMGQGDQTARLGAFGASELKSVAFGVGTSGGIHRLMVVVEMPRVGLRMFVPQVDTKLEVRAAGMLDAVVVIGLPDPGDLATLENLLLTTTTPQQMQKYLEAKRLLVEEIGFSPEELLAAIGQDLNFLFDEAGQYAAVRLRDAKAFEALLDKMAAKPGYQHTQHEIAGHTYHHLAMPSVTAIFPNEAENNDGKEQVPPKLLKRLVELPSHLFWIREDDYLLIANVPQVLIDRNYITERTNVRDWLAGQQRLGPDGALLLASMRSSGIPAFIYQLNLQLIQFLGDLVDRPVDLFAFPSPRELKLPAEGSYGFKIASTPTELSLEFDFENNPAEILMTGNAYTGVAVLGILAAVAIPAYQDYTVKARMQAGVNAGMAMRGQVAEFAIANNRFPNAVEVKAVNSSVPANSDYTLLLRPDNGQVVVSYRIRQFGDKNTLAFVPTLSAGEVEWKCVSDINPRFQPRVCR